MPEDEVGTHTESISWMKGRLGDGGEEDKERELNKSKERENIEKKKKNSSEFN